MRIILLYLLVSLFTLLVLPPLADAQGYIEKKDNDAIGTIERSLAKIDRVPALFDGTKIPEGADLQAVDALLGALTVHLKAATGSFNSLSDKGMQRPELAKLKAKYDDLTSYRNALAPAYSKASTEAEANKRKAHADQQAAVKASNQRCTAFIKELHDGSIRGEVDRMLDQVDKGCCGYGTVKDGERYKLALEKLATICKKPEYASVSKDCNHKGAEYCTLPGRSAELMKLSVMETINHHVKHLDITTVERFEKDKGWVQVDGVPSFKDYFSGKKHRDALTKLIAPMLTQAGMATTEADALFTMITTKYAELEAKARELAPKLDLPGPACAGAGCSQARTFFSQWYRGATIKRFLHTEPGWKILTNDFGVPTYRERYGYALVQVKGEALCQLRMWTYSEQHAGGGRYTAGRDVSLGYVRWQTCK
jgi:hypothetical protein